MSNWLAIWLSLMSLVAFSQKGKYTPAHHIMGADTLNYRIHYPEDFQEGKQYPLVLFLHGAGERGEDNKKQLVHGSRPLVQYADSVEEAVIVFPQCPPEDYWANVDRRRDENGNLKFGYPEVSEPRTAMRLTLSMLDSMLALRFIDSQRVYFGGLSMGGMGTFELLSRRPGIPAAAFIICGGGNPINVSKYADDVSIWVFHGKNDHVVLPVYAERMVDELRRLNADVRYTSYEEVGHNSWDRAFSEPELLPWIFSKTKSE